MVMPLDSLRRDTVYAFRQMRRTPMVAVAVIASAAIGIAANTTIFSAVKAVLLGTLPIPQPERVLSVYAGPGMRPVSYPAYTAFRDAGAFEHLAAFFPLVPASLNDGVEPERLWGQVGTANYFAAMRIPFAAGRGFRPDEENAHVVVLAHSLWVRRFRADPAVIGRQVSINRGFYTVIGVAQRGFHGTIRGLLSEFWVPLGTLRDILPSGAAEENSRMSSPDHSWLLLTGRLKDDVGRERAQTILNTVDRRMGIERKLGPDRPDPLYLETAGSIPFGIKQAGLMLAILMTVSGMVLLIACAKRCEPAAGEGARTSTRDVGTPCGRRIARPSGPSAPYGERVARAAGRARGTAVDMVGRVRTSNPQATDSLAARPGLSS